MPSDRPAGLHHVAYACRDIDATHHFYEDLMGFPLVHTELEEFPEGGYFRHVFYDLGNGSCLAFFDVHGVGERDGWSERDLRGQRAAGVGQPHRLRRRRGTPGRGPLANDDGRHRPVMELDHGWCHSLYYLDPNGIMVELCRDTPGFEPDPGRRACVARSGSRHADSA